MAEPTTKTRRPVRRIEGRECPLATMETRPADQGRHGAFLEEGSAPKVEFGDGNEVYYAKGATQADAQALIGGLLRGV